MKYARSKRYKRKNRYSYRKWLPTCILLVVLCLLITGVAGALYGVFDIEPPSTTHTTVTTTTTATTTTATTTTSTTMATTTTSALEESTRGTTKAPLSIPVNTYRGAKPKTAVPMILQNPALPTGCEATAATMLLRAYGYEVTKEAFATALPKGSFSYANGRTYGPHPNDAFLGNPFTTAGYGIFSALATRISQQFIDAAKGHHKAVDLKGVTETEILSYLDQGIPVCIWATMSMVPLRDAGGWYVKKGDVLTDQWFSCPGNEHCMVITGYSDTIVAIHDPLKGKVSYNRDTFFARFKDVGSQAMILQPKN